MDNIYKLASSRPANILLAEGDDPRVRQAAEGIKEKGIAKPVLLTRVPLNGIDSIDYISDHRSGSFREDISRSGSFKDKEEILNNPLFMGAWMLKNGAVDGMVCGAVNTTALTIRAAIKIIGLKDKGTTLSSFFLMHTACPEFGEQGSLLFADCAVIPDPNPQQLANIAVTTGDSAIRLFGWEPRIAMLSFSTHGSATHASVKKVLEAVRLAREYSPGLQIDGEMQLDSALVPEIGRRKAPESHVAGRANILVFPDLNSGNIGYKLVERFARAQATGPILQGLKKPVNDLSRGCSAEDIINVAAFTAAQVHG